MQLLITGGAGFIGSHLVDRLLESGHRVRVLDSLDPQVHAGGERPRYLDPEIELVVADVRDHEAVAAALEGVERVVHFAAAVGVGQSMYEIERYTSVNSLGCAVVLEEVVACAMRSTRCSSPLRCRSTARGSTETRRRATRARAGPPPRDAARSRAWDVARRRRRAARARPTAETKPLQPTSVYAVGKRDHEELTLAVGAAYEIPSVALRFFNVYGSRQSLGNPYTGVAAIFASRLLSGNAPLVFEDGRQTRDFIDVRDIARACELALTGPGADGWAGKSRHWHADVGARRRDGARDGLDLDFEPEIVGQYRAGDIRHCYADPRLAEELLGFSAEISFKDGMRDLLDWLSGQEAVDRVDSALEALTSRGLTR